MMIFEKNRKEKCSEDTPSIGLSGTRFVVIFVISLTSIAGMAMWNYVQLVFQLHPCVLAKADAYVNMHVGFFGKRSEAERVVHNSSR